jgi:hypothetical protein
MYCALGSRLQPDLARSPSRPDHPIPSAFSLFSVPSVAACWPLTTDNFVNPEHGSRLRDTWQARGRAASPPAPARASRRRLRAMTILFLTPFVTRRSRSLVPSTPSPIRAVSGRFSFGRPPVPPIQPNSGKFRFRAPAPLRPAQNSAPCPFVPQPARPWRVPSCRSPPAGGGCLPES